MNNLAKALQKEYGYNDQEAQEAARNLGGLFEVLSKVSKRLIKEEEAKLDKVVNLTATTFSNSEKKRAYNQAFFDGYEKGAEEKPLPVYLSVKQFADKHQFIPIGGLRLLIFNKDKNGFAPVVKKMGKKVLLDEAKFFEWLEARNK